MKKSYPLLFAAGLVALIVGYIELRLPVTVGAQGRDAVYERLATGVLAFETALTPTMTGRLAATGTASEATFLRGDGAWATLGSDFYSAFGTSTMTNHTDTDSAYVDSISVSSVVVPENATVVVSYYASRIVATKNFDLQSIPTAFCRITLLGTINMNHRDKLNLSQVFVLTPSAGTYTYSVTFAVSQESICSILNATLLIQVVK